MTTKNMNTAQRYITKGVETTIPLVVQINLWQMLTYLIQKEEKVDYLQIFKLSKKMEDNQHYQTVQHTQEEPPFESTVSFRCVKPVEEKVYIISSTDDDGKLPIWTMLLAEEY